MQKYYIWWSVIFVIGLVKNQKLPTNILTPTTKAVDHDVPVTPDEVDLFDMINNFPFFSNWVPLYFTRKALLLLVA